MYIQVIVLILLILVSVVSIFITLKMKSSVKEIEKQNIEFSNALLLMEQRLKEKNEETLNLKIDILLNNIKNEFNRESTLDESRFENIRNTLNNQLKDLRDSNSKHLEKIQETVNEKLQKTLEERLSESFRSVSENLEKVYKGLGEMRNLAEGVGDLKNVLSNVKQKGILGEIQLKNILDEILIPSQYEENFATIPNSSERVEFAIKLPGNDNRVYLPIDSKFPSEIYSQLMDDYESMDNARLKKTKQELRSYILKSAKDIRTKYVQVPHTTDYGIMFLPFEGLYAEVLKLDIFHTLQSEYKIIVAGPTTMAAVLNSISMSFKNFAIQERSVEVWNTLGQAKKEFGKFSATLENVQKGLDKANKELDNLVGTRTKKIQRVLRDVEVLDDSNSNLLDSREDF